MSSDKKREGTDQSSLLYSTSAKGNEVDKNTHIVSIDGIKVMRANVDFEKLLNSIKINLPLHVDANTGEQLKIARYAKYKGLQFELKYDVLGNQFLKLKGSLHKYFNNGQHNKDNFTYGALLHVVNELKNEFGIEPNTVLNNVEFGYNFRTSFDPTKFIRGLIAYQKTMFKFFTIEGSIGVQCDKTNFRIKVYSKGHHCKEDEFILRVEIAVIKMRKFSDEGIKLETLEDLLNIDIYPMLIDVIHKTILGCIFFDDEASFDHLPPKDRETILRGLRPLHWERIGKHITTKERKKYEREKDRFNYLAETIGATKIKHEVLHLIDEQKREYFTDFSNTNRSTIEPKFKELETTQKGNISYLRYHVNDSLMCLVCSKSLEHKKTNAKFCSKKCKNDYTNPKLNLYHQVKRKIERRTKEPTLFEVPEMFNPELIEILSTPNSIYSN